jgi:NAD(P)-dependent dehydrogenase (short-subunit alcohol dehydrogenase family)
MSDNLLKDRVIAITGASQGLGLAAATVLVSRGAKVALIARNREALDKACKMLNNNGSEANAQAFPTDITDHDAVQQTFAAINQSFGQLDGLVNNAGLARPNKICDTDPQELLLQMNTNIAGVIYCCKAALPLLKKSSNGRILNISSASARSRMEISHLGVYSATKCAVDRLSDEMRDELREEGIAVTVLSPGATMTDFAAGWNTEKLMTAFRAWREKSKYFDGYMDMKYVGQAIADCFNYPKGVCIDFVEIRPSKKEEKPKV